MVASNIGRINFDYTNSPGDPLVVGLGLLGTTQVKHIKIENVGVSTAYAYGIVATASSSPSIAIFPGQSAVLSLNGAAGAVSSVALYKLFDPWFINMHSTVAPSDRPASLVIQDLD